VSSTFAIVIRTERERRGENKWMGSKGKKGVKGLWEGRQTCRGRDDEKDERLAKKLREVKMKNIHHT